MAFTAAANANQRVGNYAPGSLAAQPRRFAGGVRKRGESPDQMANRMDAGYMASAMQGGTTAPTKADNIAKARADGTFDAKRNAFNAANSGSFMDAAGNIGPKAEMPAPASPTPVNTVTPPTQTTGMSPRDMDAKQAKNAAVQKRAAQDRNFSRTRVALEKIHGNSTRKGFWADKRDEWRADGSLNKRDPEAEKVLAEPPASPSPRLPASPSPSPGLRPPVTRTASGELVQPGTPMNPNARWQKPAGLMAAASMNKYGPTAGVSASKDQGVMAVAANGGKPLPAPKPVPAPAAKPAGMVAAATPAKPYSGPMARPPGQVDAKPGTSKATPASKPAGIVAAATPQAQPTQPKAETRQTASLPTANHSSPKPPAEPSLEELRQKAEAAKAARQPGLTKVAKSFVGAAQAVDKAVPAAVSSVTSGIKNTGDSIVLAIDRRMAPARRWLYGSNQETPEEKAYREAMAKRKPATSQPAAKKQTPTFRTPYLPNRRTAFSIN